MDLGLLFILIGIILAALVNWTLGILLVVVGIILLLVPRVRA